MGKRNDIDAKAATLKKLERGPRVREMSLKGMSAREIATELGVHHTTIYGDLNEMIAKATESNKADIEEKRRVLVFRYWEIYDEMMARVIREGSSFAAKAASDALAGIARLEGLNAPDKIAPTDPGGGKEYVGGGLDSSGASKLVALLNAARARRDNADTGDGPTVDSSTGSADNGGGNGS